MELGRRRREDVRPRLDQAQARATRTTWRTVPSIAFAEEYTGLVSVFFGEVGKVGIEFGAGIETYRLV